MSKLAYFKEKPDDIINVLDRIPNLQVGMNYSTSSNFTGSIVPGYNSKNVFLHCEAVASLERIQKKLNTKDLSLYIFDAYRPHKSVLYFCEQWVKSEDNLTLKSYYYPNKSKEQVLNEGFLAPQSSHSHGSTVDVSILDLQSNKLLDMGGHFDFFDESSFTKTDLISDRSQKNRYFLKELMEKNGFLNYHKEWWHFRHKICPYYKKFIFDFDID